ncbi:MAG TPA: hypothetical protein PK239_14095 [Chitinophagales bacterium]|nr:hypothetical protein [Chitinophagales bacterium]HRK28402.1 hypothetical protein [Chitinophagales bacterium]
MKRIILITFLYFAFNECLAQIKVITPEEPAQEMQVQEPAQKTAFPSKPSYQFVMKEKNPAAAYILSLAVPAAGQMYNGEVRKGISILVVEAIGLTMASAGAGWIYESIDPEFGDWLFWAGLSLTSATHIYSVFDAPISAQRINKKIRSGEYGTSIHIKLSPAGAGLCLNF